MYKVTITTRPNGLYRKRIQELKGDKKIGDFHIQELWNGKKTVEAYFADRRQAERWQGI
jgi:hypothetical protein